MQKIRAKTGYVMWDVRCGMCDAGCARWDVRVSRRGWDTRDGKESSIVIFERSRWEVGLE